MLLTTILFVTLVVFFISLKGITVGDNEKVAKVQEDEKPAFELSGYYYFGYLDARPKQELELEQEYFYYMDEYFQDYFKNFMIITRSDEVIEQDYLHFFEALGVLELYSFPTAGLGLRNGDYVTIHVTVPIKESYPMQISQIENFEIIYPRIP